MSQCPKWTWNKYSRREEHLECGSTSLNLKEIFLPFKELASLLPRRRLRERSSTLYYQSQAVSLPEIEVWVFGDLSRLRLKEGSQALQRAISLCHTFMVKGFLQENASACSGPEPPRVYHCSRSQSRPTAVDWTKVSSSWKWLLVLGSHWINPLP